MFDNKSILIINLIAAGILTTGSHAVQAASSIAAPTIAPSSIAESGPGYDAPGMPFDPQGNSIGRGKLRLFPEVSVAAVYDDNIFLDDSGKSADEIIHVIPRLMIDYSLQERGNFRIGYTGNFAFYNDFSDSNWQMHNVGLDLDYRAPSGLTFKVADAFVDTSDPFGSRDEYALGQQKDRWYNLLGVSLGYRHADKLKILGYFNYNKQEYDNKEVDYSQNFDESQYGIGVEKRLTGRSWGFVRYYYVSRDFTTASPDSTENKTNNADYTSDRVNLGLTWDATSRITGELNVGYEARDYENPEDPDGNPYENDETWLAATNINYSLKPGVTELNFRLMRGIYARGSNTSESFVSTDLGISILHKFFSWYRLNIYLGLGNNDYNNSRSDDSYRAGIGLEYLVWRRFTLGIGYDYYRRDSNLPGDSWTNNRVMGTLILRY